MKNFSVARFYSSELFLSIILIAAHSDQKFHPTLAAQNILTGAGKVSFCKPEWTLVILLFQPILSPLQQKRILIHLNQLQNIKLERNRHPVSVDGQKRGKLNFDVLSQ